MKKRWIDSEIQHILLQCLDGLTALHKADIFHRDIKTANLTIMRDGSLKIIDFGEAERYKADADKRCVFRKGKGTPLYWAPELKSKKAVILER